MKEVEEGEEVEEVEKVEEVEEVEEVKEVKGLCVRCSEDSCFAVAGVRDVLVVAVTCVHHFFNLGSEVSPVVFV